MENLFTKRNIIIAVVVIIIIIGALLYFGFKKSGESGTGGGFFGFFPSSSQKNGGSSGQGEGENNQTPGAGQIAIPSQLPLGPDAAKALLVGTLIRLSEDNVSSLTIVGSTTARYHKNVAENLGHLFERRADGSDEERRLSNFTIPQVARVVWAADAKRAVVFYNLDGQIRKLLIDYSTSTPRTNFLPDSISAVAFSPDSKSLAFINNLGDTQNIFVASSDFKNPRKIFDNTIPELELSWPNTNFLALKTKSSYAVNGFLYMVDVKNGVLSKVAEGLGLDAIWNSDGSGVLYSKTDSNGGMFNLTFLNVKTREEKSIGIRTIAEKCVFFSASKNKAFCAVPKNPPAAKYPDEWWQGKISFADDFVAIDVDGSQASVFVPANMDVIALKFVSDDSYLIFTDKITGFLWSLKLKP